jgi:Fe-S cluster biogenesis protein NfuA
MFIQTQTTNDPDTMEFVPGRDVLPHGPLAFNAPEEATRSPLAARLFELDNVRGVTLNTDNVAITKAPNAEWLTLKPHVLAAVMQHFTEGRAVLEETPAASGDGDGDAAPAVGDSEEMPDYEALAPESNVDEDLIDEVRELIETRIEPAIEQTGGEIEFHSMVDGTVNLRLAGSAYSMLPQVETMLKHYVPEIEKVQDFMDAIPKPGLETETGRRVREVLDEKINPAVAGHGGHISLIDIRGKRVFLRLEGGCQGCGMAGVTLKQGVEAEIKKAAPEVTEILDVTDHASGTNPYYQPGKGGGESAVAQ